MSFTRDFITIIKNRDNEIYEISSRNGLTISRYDKNDKLIYSKKMYDGYFTFIDYWFEIDNNDTIYGIVNDKKGSLVYILIKDNVIIKKKLLDFTASLVTIKFVYIKKENNALNIIYYYSEKSSPHKYNLVHYYKNITGWHKNIIDSVSYNTLTNYVVLYNSSKNMSILYFKLCSNHEELFLSFFNKESLTWQKPIQLTNSNYDKIYLSALIDKNNNYHILFSEKTHYRYQCSYISGRINSNCFLKSNYTTLGSATACSFPVIIERNSILSALWTEYNNLYISSSNDLGRSWEPVFINTESCSTPFTCCNYKSNSVTDNNLNYFSVFTAISSFKILGI